jgi:hypothetical protein
MLFRTEFHYWKLSDLKPLTLTLIFSPWYLSTKSDEVTRVGAVLPPRYCILEYRVGSSGSKVTDYRLGNQESIPDRDRHFFLLPCPDQHRSLLSFLSSVYCGFFLKDEFIRM